MLIARKQHYLSFLQFLSYFLNNPQSSKLEIENHIKHSINFHFGKFHS